MRWEYAHLVWEWKQEAGRVAALVFSHRPSWDLSENPSLAVVLGLLGDDGWEMVGMSATAAVMQAGHCQVLYVLKRPAPAPVPNGPRQQLPALPDDPLARLAAGLRDD